MDAERMEFSRRHFDIFLAGYFVLLMHLQITGLAVKIPARAPLERHGDDRLRRIKFDEFAVHVDPRPTNYSASVHREEICVCHHAGPVHLKLEKLLSVHVLRSSDAVQNRETNFPVGVWFYIGHPESLAHFLRHVVSPPGSVRSRNRLSRPGVSERRCGKQEAYNFHFYAWESAKILAASTWSDLHRHAF